MPKRTEARTKLRVVTRRQKAGMLNRQIRAIRDFHRPNEMAYWSDLKLNLSALEIDAQRLSNVLDEQDGYVSIHTKTSLLESIVEGINARMRAVRAANENRGAWTTQRNEEIKAAEAKHAGNT